MDSALTSILSCSPDGSVDDTYATATLNPEAEKALARLAAIMQNNALPAFSQPSPCPDTTSVATVKLPPSSTSTRGTSPASRSAHGSPSPAPSTATSSGCKTKTSRKRKANATTAERKGRGVSKRLKDLTPDERRARRLESNQQAAAVCRRKKKEHYQTLEQKCADLTDINARLRRRIEDIARQVELLPPEIKDMSALAPLSDLLTSEALALDGMPKSTEKDNATVSSSQASDIPAFGLQQVAVGHTEDTDDNMMIKSFEAELAAAVGEQISTAQPDHECEQAVAPSLADDNGQYEDPTTTSFAAEMSAAMSDDVNAPYRTESAELASVPFATDGADHGTAVLPTENPDSLATMLTAGDSSAPVESMSTMADMDVASLLALEPATGGNANVSTSSVHPVLHNEDEMVPESLMEALQNGPEVETDIQEFLSTMDGAFDVDFADLARLIEETAAPSRTG